MYLKSNGRYYDSGGSQHARRAPFLILVSSAARPFGPDNFRALVRKVALHQMGHWMMGVARVKGQSITLSGSYGGDGLTVDVSEEIFQLATPVPSELYEAWAKGGGHNSAGSEAQVMQEWAIETFKVR